MGSLTVLFMVSSVTDVLAEYVDEESHEEASKGISSVTGPDRAGGLQETFAHRSQCRNAITTV